MLRWQGEERFVVGESTFQMLAPGLGQAGAQNPMKGADLLVLKPRSLVERYVALVDELQPQWIFELGIFHGGSTALLAELARPQRLVAIDRRTNTPQALAKHLAARGLGDVVRTYAGVDQADRPRLAEIAEEALGDQPLDLVVDDCSHMYEPTRASFSELFPRLRPGGIYMIEDWPWAHTRMGDENLEGPFPDQVPLTRLIFELVLAIPAMPELIEDISVEGKSVLVKRGEAPVDPSTFDISACSNPRGRSLLAD